MADNIQMGWNAKVRINDTVFGIRRGTVSDTAAEHEVGDTEGGDQTKTKTGRGTLAADLQLFEDSTPGEYAAAPLNIKRGNLVKFQFYPRGLAAGAYTCLEFRISNVRHGVDVDNPNDFSFSGKNWSRYTVPGEA